MNVPGGSSAMVSILKKEADGEVVYLFDPETPARRRVLPVQGDPAAQPDRFGAGERPGDGLLGRAVHR